MTQSRTGSSFLLISLWKDQQPWALKGLRGAAHLTGGQRQLHQGWTHPLAPPCEWHSSQAPSLHSMGWTHTVSWARDWGDRLGGLCVCDTHQAVPLQPSSEAPNSPLAQSRADPNSCCLLWDSTSIFYTLVWDETPRANACFLGRKQTFSACFYQNNSEIQVLA